MRKARPSILILSGSILFYILSFLFTLFVHLQIVTLSNTLIFLIPLVTGIFAYTIFYYIIKRFLQYRMSLIYRSIQSLEQNTPKDQSIDDLVAQGEQDVQDWKQKRTQEIEKLKEQAAFRKEFLGNLAHELKTPVFSIQGYIDSLLDGGMEDPAIRKTFLERAALSTERMTHILDDLDQLTKLELERIPLDIRSFDLLELIQETFEAMELIAKEKRFGLRTDVSEPFCYVNADRNKMTQVLLNLISNAISYGNEGGELCINVVEIENTYNIQIKDNGPGIEPEHIPRLFERFYRVEKSRNRNEGGSGLGLAIVKHIIESHGQQIQVSSTFGIGTTFTFSLEKSKATGPVSSRGIPLK
ncbi:MAG: sensor histidine kinase [Sphingomonadales bacterium]|nr:sensor histidine kinase [Sphingomonadales bacterium]